MIIGTSGYAGVGKDTVGKIIQELVIKNSSDIKCKYADTNILAPEGRQFLSGWEIKKYAGKMKQIASILTGIPVEWFEDQAFKKTYLGDEWARWTTVTKDLRVMPTQVTYGEFFSTEAEAQKDCESIRRMIKRKGIDNVTVEPILKRITVREFLQRLGTEAMRDVIHPNTWVNALFADYKPLMSLSGIEIDFASKQSFKDGEPFYGPVPLEHPKWIITDVRFPNEAKAIKDRGGIILRIDRPAKVDLGPRRTDWMHPSETALDTWDFDYEIDNDGGVEDLMEKIKTFLEVFNIHKL